NLTIESFADTAIRLSQVTDIEIKNCDIEDAAYAGILIMSGIGGSIADNTIRRIGYTTDPNGANGNKAYGIPLSPNATDDFTANPRSWGITLDGNLVEDVPLWHCLDTHAGSQLTFNNNIVRRCPRAVFITGDSLGYHPENIAITGNHLEEAVTKPGGTNTA